MEVAAKIDREFYSAELEEAYRSFISALRKVAIVYTVSAYAQLSLQDMEPEGQRVRISDDFDDGYTTIISDGEIANLIKSNGYQSLAREQCVISICSIFEHFIDTLLDILNLNREKARNYKTISKDYNLNVKPTNTTLKKIYYIVKNLKLTSHPFEHDQPTKLLEEIFAIRNVIIHSGSIIKSEFDDNRIFAPHKNNNKIKLQENSLDDFLHRIVIHMSGITKRVDEYLQFSEQSNT